MDTTVSVALATYNGERYLRSQLDSIARQSHQPNELVIGDDLSTDGTARIVADFAKTVQFPVLFCRNAQRLGSTGNFSLTISRCSGDIIVLSDQDDIWSEGRIVRSLETLRSHPRAGYVFSNASLIDGCGNALAGTLWARTRFDRKRQRMFGRQRIAEVLLKSNVVTGATMALRRSLLSPTLPIPTDWVHDGWLALVLGSLHEAVAVDEFWIAYRVHAAQQVGLDGGAVSLLLNTHRRDDAARYRAEAHNFQLAAARLDELGPIQMQVAMAAREKAEFLERRAESRSSLSKCLVGLRNSLVEGSYSRYGLGLPQAAFDLLCACELAVRRKMTPTQMPV